MHKISICWIIFLTLIVMDAWAQSSSQGKVLFILDGSGSMWGQIENKAKISIAKEAMTNLIRDLPAGVDAGLQVYGHRKKGDCNDIEMLSPVGKSDHQTLIRQVQSIKPKGKTPITQSFALAGEQLRGVEEETSVVLISDGKETCDADPCVMVRELRDQGINVRVHVVGFDVNAEERKQLVCIAEAGGGKYFSADSTDELKEALTEVVEDLRPARCAAYAETSVEQEQTNLENECSLAGAHWHMDQDKHYNWCLSHPMESARPDEQTQARAAALEQCKIASQRRIIWEDYFDRNQLGDAYRNAQPDESRLRISNGSLSSTTYFGTGSSASGRNYVLLKRSIEGDHSATVKVEIQATPFNYAGLYYQFERGNWIGVAVTTDKDRFILFSNSVKRKYSAISRLHTDDLRRRLSNSIDYFPNEPEVWYLRLEKRGFDYTAKISSDGHEWIHVGTQTYLNDQSGNIGFQASQWQAGGEERVAKFDDFIVERLD